MRAKKRFGQNFLRDESVIQRIIEALDLVSRDRVIEIGPGEGALTGKILERDADLTAVEVDRDLIPVLRSRFGNDPNFDLVEADFLALDLMTLPRPGDAKLKIVGNLPYYISTPILEHLMSTAVPYDRLVLMLQREVVERITAMPGDSERGYFTVLIENAFVCETLMTVPPSAFRPSPAVHSAVVRLRPKERLIRDDTVFRSLLSACFAQKRKTLLNNLRHVTPDAGRFLDAAGIDTKRRAETLSLEEWRLLSNLVDAPTPGQVS